MRTIELKGGRVDVGIRLHRVLLTMLASCFVVFAVRALHAADTKEPTAQLSQFKLGEYLTGPKVTLNDATNKAVLIDAWGIHCGPCLASLPEMERIAKRYKNKMLVFGAHCQNGTDDEVEAVVKRNRLSYTIVKGVQAPISFRGIPHVFVFDPTGALVFSGHPADKSFERSLHKVISKVPATSGVSAKNASVADAKVKTPTTAKAQTSSPAGTKP
ncbi:MAG: TlpA disulfide reductase family protein [Kiritimatiellaeota bacterium]|nr:TlpA disulfide reductase family protein [Kiritimatiellota bacterium]